MRHSMSKDTAFNGETTPRHTFLFSDLQCLPPGDPRILCAKHGYPITGKSFIYKANQSTNNPIELKIVLKLAHLLWPLEQKRNSCTVHGITQFRTTSCKYKIMTLLPKYGVSLTPKYGQKCKWKMQNLRVFAYVAWDYESAAEATSVASLAIGSLRYGDYGLRLRINMLLRMIKTTWLFIFPA